MPLLYSDSVLVGDDLTLQSALIHVKEQRILSVSPCTRNECQDVVYEDLGNQLVAPAWVNIHTHLPMTAFRGIGGLLSKKGNVVEDLYFQLEKELLPNDIRCFSRIAAIEAISNGIGFCFEHYYHAIELAKGFMDVGLCAAISPTIQDKAGPGKERFEEAIHNTEYLHQNQKFRDHGIYTAVGPHASDTVSSSLFRIVCQHGIPSAPRIM